MNSNTRYVIERQSEDEVCVWAGSGMDQRLHTQFWGESCLEDAREAFPGAEEDHSWSADDDGYDYGPSEEECRRAERRAMLCD
jgi:hypothetical protein